MFATNTCGCECSIPTTIESINLTVTPSAAFSFSQDGKSVAFNPIFTTAHLPRAVLDRSRDSKFSRLLGGHADDF